MHPDTPGLARAAQLPRTGDWRIVYRIFQDRIDILVVAAGSPPGGLRSPARAAPLEDEPPRWAQGPPAPHQGTLELNLVGKAQRPFPGTIRIRITRSGASTYGAPFPGSNKITTYGNPARRCKRELVSLRLDAGLPSSCVRGLGDCSRLAMTWTVASHRCHA